MEEDWVNKIKVYSNSHVTKFQLLFEKLRTDVNP